MGIKHATEMDKMAVRSLHAVRRINELEHDLGRASSLAELRATVERSERFFMLEHEEWHA